jgi:glycerophosphoryl diester phosphodiesterase
VPFVVAHRAGNDLAHLKEAESLGIRLIEADVRLWRGRLEVRHLKTVGALPIFWDRWKLASPFAARLQLGELLDAVRPETELLLDLKGVSSRLSRLVLDALPEDRDVTVCARSWRLLEPFAAKPRVRRVHSVGSARQLRRLLQRFEHVDGVSIHERLLDPATVATLRSRASVLMSWPVNTVERARELVALGIDGLISDQPAVAGRALQT